MIFEYKARKLSINYEPLKIRYKLLVAYIYIYIYIYIYVYMYIVHQNFFRIFHKLFSTLSGT
jgi:hypothetical protein